MKSFFLRRTIVVAVIFAVLGGGSLTLYFLRNASEKNTSPDLVGVAATSPRNIVIGSSVEGRAIDAYEYGNGATHLAFVGGIHGGYEWNSVLLAYEFMDYLSENPKIIPENVSINVIPSANPDGVYKIIGKEGRFTIGDVPMDVSAESGRLNANSVDLNRNFDCKWKPKSTWRGNIVNAGSMAFSEPEARAIRNFVLENNPDAVVFWHSQSNAVYASECEDDILPKTLEIMEAYSRASGYPAIDSFDAYEITGDAEGWLASIGIPAITVELKTHEAIELERNLAGVRALLEYYRK